jgi:molecular chaperone GrpE (heat shock protein)
MRRITESFRDSQRWKPCFARNLGRSSGLVALGVLALIGMLFAGSLTLALQSGQQTPDDKAQRVTKDPIDIKVKAAPITQRQYRFDDQKHDEAELKFIGDGQTWSFITFAPFPPHTKLTIKGDPPGYTLNEGLASGKWYPFKQWLSVTLKIDSEASQPVDVSFWVGSVKTSHEDFLKTQNFEVVRKFADENQSEITQAASAQLLGFKWGAVPSSSGENPVRINPTEVKLEVPEELGEAPYQSTTVVGDGKRWTFIRPKQLREGIALIARTANKDGLTIPPDNLLASDQWIGFKNSLNLNVSLIKDKLPPEGDMDVVIETALGPSLDQSKEEAIAAIKSGATPSSNNLQLKVAWARPVDDSGFWLRIGLPVLGALGMVVVVIVLMRRRKSRSTLAPSLPKASPSRDPLDDLGVDEHTPTYTRYGTGEIDGLGGHSAPAKQTGPSGGILKIGGGLYAKKAGPPAQPEERLERPTTDIRSPSSQPPFSQPQMAPEASLARSRIGYDRDDLGQLIKARVSSLRVELNQKVNEDHATLAAEVKSLEGKVSLMEGGLESRMAARIKPVEELLYEKSSLIEQTQKQRDQQITQMTHEGEAVKTQLRELQAELGEVEKRLQTRFVELQSALNRRSVPDSFYARTVGAILGQHIEALQDGNFEKLMGEQLNQFFETNVERGEKLQELRVRAEGINSALKAVSVQMEKLSPPASVEARQPMQRVEAFVNELSGLQSQMRSRRATIETTLRVAVSMHAGARQTFLDELGRGIKREIDKLNDPESYFEGEMERVITSDIIAIVDICDKTVAPPPSARPDLEAALKQLFEQAGLRPILPRRGEPFKTAEQDLIEMAPGAGQSLTVAQVVTRGFYYKHRDNETLLRKASVTVYR